MFFCEDGNCIRADLVGDVAVGRDAVGTDNNRPDLAFAHHGAGHVVGDHSGQDAVFHQLPGGEA